MYAIVYLAFNDLGKIGCESLRLKSWRHLQALNICMHTLTKVTATLEIKDVQSCQDVGGVSFNR